MINPAGGASKVTVSHCALLSVTVAEAGGTAASRVNDQLPAMNSIATVSLPGASGKAPVVQ